MIYDLGVFLESLTYFYFLDYCLMFKLKMCSDITPMTHYGLYKMCLDKAPFNTLLLIPIKKSRGSFL